MLLACPERLSYCLLSSSSWRQDLFWQRKKRNVPVVLVARAIDIVLMPLQQSDFLHHNSSSYDDEVLVNYDEEASEVRLEMCA